MDIHEIAEFYGLKVAETTTGMNGYPRDLRPAIKGFETITDLHEIVNELTAKGRDVQIIETTWKNGWSLRNWTRDSADKGTYTRVGERDWAISVSPDENPEDVARDVVIGNDPEHEVTPELKQWAKEFAEELGGYQKQHEGQGITVFFDPDQCYAIERALTDEATGYSGDSKNWELAIFIEE